MANQVDIIIRAVDKGMSKVFGDLGTKVKKSKTALDAFNQSMKKTNKAASALTGKLGALFAGVGAGMVTQSLFKAGVEAERLALAFEAIAGSAGGAGTELDYIREQSERLGLVFYKTADSYKQIFAAGEAGNVSLDDTRKIFVGMAEAATALGMSEEQATGSFRALGQMMGKNKVQAEELRQQLGEKLPTAIQFMAEAYGGSVEELEKAMAVGEVGVETIVKFSEILHERYGSKAEEASSKAIGALNAWKNAWWDLKVVLAQSGFLDESVAVLKRMTATLKDPAVQQAIKAWATGFFDLAGSIAKITWEWKGWIVGLVGGTVAISILGRIAGVIVAVQKAMVVLTGMKIGTWFAALVAPTKKASVAMLGFKATVPPLIARLRLLRTVMLKSVAVLGAFGVGWEIGTLLNKFDAVKRAGIAMAAGLHKAWIRVNRGFLLPFAKEAQVQQELAKVDAVYAKMFANVGKVGEAAHKKVAKAAHISAEKQKKVVYKVTDEMKKKYQEYGAEVKRITLAIGGQAQTVAEQLRSMSRGGMSDFSAWKDRKKEAEEYEAAALAAAEAAEMAFADGYEKEAKMLFEGALKYAEKARGAYADLAGEVTEGDKVLLSGQEALKEAMNGVESAGALAVIVLEKQKKASKDAMDGLDQQSGNRLSGVDSIKAVSEATEKYAHMVIPSMGKAYTLVWDNAERTGKAMIKEIDLATRQMIDKKRTMTIDIVTREVKKLGGVVGAKAMAVGGRVQNAMNGFHFPGYGGGDRPKNLVMAEDGEVMIRKEMVKRAGLRAALAFNSGRFDILISELMARFSPAGIMMKHLGGLIAPQMAPPPLLMSGGGEVSGSGTTSSGGAMRVELNFPTAGPPIKTTMTRSMFQQLTMQAERIKGLAS